MCCSALEPRNGMNCDGAAKWNASWCGAAEPRHGVTCGVLEPRNGMHRGAVCWSRDMA